MGQDKTRQPDKTTSVKTVQAYARQHKTTRQKTRQQNTKQGKTILD